MITHSVLNQRIGFPLEIKITYVELRIQEFYNKLNGDCFIAFSGGKDSTVLLDIARKIYPKIKAVFVDTGLEFPEIREFVKTIDNVDWIKPKMNFREVLDKYGYPVISKVQATTLRKLRTQNLSDRYRNKLMNGDERGTAGKLSNKWKFMLNAPFKISEQCCDIMKKNPINKYIKLNKKYPIVGTMATDSRLRKNMYLKNGCNYFGKKIQSQPMSIWTENDIWDYIKSNKLNYSKIYDKGYDRTGCVFCMFGLDQEKKNTGFHRFEKMEKTHPILLKYCNEKLNLKKILDFLDSNGLRCNGVNNDK